MEPERITIDDLRPRLDAGERITFVDARSADSYAKATERIPKSIRVPPDEAASRAGTIPREHLVVTYCT